MRASKVQGLILVEGAGSKSRHSVLFWRMRIVLCMNDELKEWVFISYVLFLYEYIFLLIFLYVEVFHNVHTPPFFARNLLAVYQRTPSGLTYWCEVALNESPTLNIQNAL